MHCSKKIKCVEMDVHLLSILSYVLELYAITQIFV